MRRFEVLIILIIVIAGLIFWHPKNNEVKSLPELQVDAQYSGNSNGYTAQSQRMQVNDQVCEDRYNAITDAVQIISPAVVSVNVIKTEIVNRYLNPFDNPFLGSLIMCPIKEKSRALAQG